MPSPRGLLLSSQIHLGPRDACSTVPLGCDDTGGKLDGWGACCLARLAARARRGVAAGGHHIDLGSFCRLRRLHLQRTASLGRVTLLNTSTPHPFEAPACPVRGPERGTMAPIGVINLCT